MIWIGVRRGAYAELRGALDRSTTRVASVVAQQPCCSPCMWFGAQSTIEYEGAASLSDIVFSKSLGLWSVASWPESDIGVYAWWLGCSMVCGTVRKMPDSNSDGVIFLRLSKRTNVQPCERCAGAWGEMVYWFRSPSS